MGERETREHRQYHPDENRALSTAILEAIEEQKGADLTKSEFQLYDDIDPDALDNLFREDATPSTSVRFNTDDVTVELRGDGAVDIEVTPRDSEE